MLKVFLVLFVTFLSSVAFLGCEEKANPTRVAAPQSQNKGVEPAKPQRATQPSNPSGSSANPLYEDYVKFLNSIHFNSGRLSVVRVEKANRNNAVGYCGIFSDGLYCYDDETNGSGFAAPPGLKDVSYVSLGTDTSSSYFKRSSCFITGQSVRCFYNNKEVSISHQFKNPIKIVHSYRYACALDSAEVKCWDTSNGKGLEVPGHLSGIHELKSFYKSSVVCFNNAKDISCIQYNYDSESLRLVKKWTSADSEILSFVKVYEKILCPLLKKSNNTIFGECFAIFDFTNNAISSFAKKISGKINEIEDLQYMVNLPSINREPDERELQTMVPEYLCLVGKDDKRCLVLDELEKLAWVNPPSPLQNSKYLIAAYDGLCGVSDPDVPYLDCWGRGHPIQKNGSRLISRSFFTKNCSEKKLNIKNSSGWGASCANTAYFEGQKETEKSYGYQNLYTNGDMTCSTDWFTERNHRCLVPDFRPRASSLVKGFVSLRKKGVLVSSASSGEWAYIDEGENGEDFLKVEYLKSDTTKRSYFKYRVSLAILSHENVDYRFIDQRDGRAISAWLDVQKDREGIGTFLQVDSFETDLAEEKILRLPHLGLEFKKNWDERIVVPLGDYCQTHPELFLNNGDGSVGCP